MREITTRITVLRKHTLKTEDHMIDRIKSLLGIPGCEGVLIDARILVN